MSVQTQIDRISGNVSAALAAIAEKGVTVPDGSNSDALAELIASIEAGGGGGVESGDWACGTYIPTETLNIGTKHYITIDTGLQEIRFFAFVRNKLSNPVAYEYIMVVWDYNGGDYYGYRLANSSGNSINSIRAAMTVNNEYVGNSMYADGGIMKFHGATSSTLVAAGNTYMWFAIGR